MDWSAEQYRKFEDERTRAARDLLAAVPPAPVDIAVDIGCGPANSTELIVARHPSAKVLGIDPSQDMIDAARTRLPAVDFHLADIRTWTPPKALDLAYANAVFQFVPDHAAALPRLVDMLAFGGALAIQVPDNLDEPTHVAMREIGRDPRFAPKLGGADDFKVPIHTPSWYYALLKPLCRRVDVWRTTYHHPLAGHAGIVEWFKGSGLRPYLGPLDAAEKAAYLEAYTARIAPHYPVLADGTVLLPFPRLFIVATR